MLQRKNLLLVEDDAIVLSAMCELLLASGEYYEEKYNNKAPLSIFYKLDILPEMAQKILYFSPMVQIFNLAHDSVIYQKIPTTESFVMATILTLGIFVICYMIFWKLKDRVIEGM